METSGVEGIEPLKKSQQFFFNVSHIVCLNIKGERKKRQWARLEKHFEANVLHSIYYGGTAIGRTIQIRPVIYMYISTIFICLFSRYHVCKTLYP